MQALWFYSRWFRGRLSEVRALGAGKLLKRDDFSGVWENSEGGLIGILLPTNRKDMITFQKLMAPAKDTHSTYQEEFPLQQGRRVSLFI